MRRRFLLLNQFCFRLRLFFIFFFGLEFLRDFNSGQLKVVKFMQVFLANGGGLLRLKGGKFILNLAAVLFSFAFLRQILLAFIGVGFFFSKLKNFVARLFVSHAAAIFSLR